MLHSLLVQQLQYMCIHVCVCVCSCVHACARMCVCVFVCLGDSTVCSAQYLVTSSHGALGLLALKKRNTHTSWYTHRHKYRQR